MEGFKLLKNIKNQNSRAHKIKLFKVQEGLKEGILHKMAACSRCKCSFLKQTILIELKARVKLGFLKKMNQNNFNRKNKHVKLA